jgi:Spy/CpxP family protein refolding chaperone
MRARVVVLLGVVVSLAACDRSTPVSPSATAAADVIDLVPDYAVSPAASIDAAGIGGSLLPDALKLTAEQKAAIAALHDAFMETNAADIAALRAIEQEAKAAVKAGKSRDDVKAILAKAVPIRERLDTAFKKLQADIWAVYTPEQRAWIESHRARGCGGAALHLTDEQVTQIRDLEQRFYASVKSDLELIRSIAEEAKKARAAGKSREEISAILAKAAAPQQRVSAAEKSLNAAILALLTPEQRVLWACRRG